MFSKFLSEPSVRSKGSCKGSRETTRGRKRKRERRVCVCFVGRDKVYVLAISLQRVMGEILRLPVLKLIIHSWHTSRFPLCGSQRMYFHTDAGVIYTGRARSRHVRGFSCTHLPESVLCKLFTDSARDLYFFGWIRTGETHVRYTPDSLTVRDRSFR